MQIRGIITSIEEACPVLTSLSGSIDTVLDMSLFICTWGKQHCRIIHDFSSRAAVIRQYLYGAPVSGTTHNYDSVRLSTSGYDFPYCVFPLK